VDLIFYPLLSNLPDIRYHLAPIDLPDPVSGGFPDPVSGGFPDPVSGGFPDKRFSFMRNLKIFPLSHKKVQNKNICAIINRRRLFRFDDTPPPLQPITSFSLEP
jgi:hypothetical protein